MNHEHSKSGIFSTVIAFIVWMYFGILTLVFLKTDYFPKFFEKYFSSHEGGMVKGMGDLGVALALLFFLFIILPIAGHLLGLILGIISCFSKNKKRLFGIAGLCLNLFPLFVFLILFLIGTLSSQN